MAKSKAATKARTKLAAPARPKRTTQPVRPASKVGAKQPSRRARPAPASELEMEPRARGRSPFAQPSSASRGARPVSHAGGEGGRAATTGTVRKRGPRRGGGVEARRTGEAEREAARPANRQAVNPRTGKPAHPKRRGEFGGYHDRPGAGEGRQGMALSGEQVPHDRSS